MPALNPPSLKATRAALLASTAIIALLTACTVAPPDNSPRSGYGVQW